ncbi:MAG: GGDEF domain-containing protein, partial [Desulfuromonas sp.]
GILYLNDFVPRELSAEDLEPLTILTSFASMSVANARLYEATKKLAATDGLTCLYNHRQFKLSLEQELNRAERSEKPLSLLMFDIDNFKKFNDCYGHPCGDLVLSRTALSLREVFRSADFIFRYGGEEFTVLMPDADREQAINAADRARQQIEQMSVCIDEADRPLKITVSAGVATYPTDGVNAQTLLSTVDELLYKAKNQGKNRVYSTCVDALCASG